MFETKIEKKETGAKELKCLGPNLHLFNRLNVSGFSTDHCKFTRIVWILFSLVDKLGPIYSNHSCSHICIALPPNTTPSSYRCLCPDGMKVKKKNWTMYFYDWVIRSLHTFMGIQSFYLRVFGYKLFFFFCNGYTEGVVPYLRYLVHFFYPFSWKGYPLSHSTLFFILSH